MILGLVIILSVFAKAIKDTLTMKGSLQMSQPGFISICTVGGILTFFVGGLVYRLIVENFVEDKYSITRILEVGESQENRKVSEDVKAQRDRKEPGEE